MQLLATNLHPGVSLLAFFQATQLNLFERFLTNAVSGIDSTGIVSGMQNMAYVILLIGFLWQVYQAATHGGDVRGLGTSLIKYFVTAIVVMNYQSIFTTINQGFVSGGNWINSASGAGNLLGDWASDLKSQFSQIGFQKMWGLITGSIAGLIDALLILVAYILYPIVIVIFGFFYILYGSILYIFGPIILALMPLGATNRLAKSYAENIFIWNAWPVLYGGLGALLSAVQMGQIGQMLNQGDFLGGLGNLEGSFLIGFVSIIYSLAIAVIPFIAKKIVSGEVGATAGALMGAAATALTAGVAAVEGIGAGTAAAGASSGAGPTSANAAKNTSVNTGTNNLPAASQKGPNNQTTPIGNGSVQSAQGPTVAAHAAQIQQNLSAAVGQNAGSAGTAPPGNIATGGANVSTAGGSHSSASRGQGGNSSGHGSSSGPSFRGHSLASWGAYHAARLGTQGVVATGSSISGKAGAVLKAASNPVETAGRVGTATGKAVGSIANAAVNTGRATGSAAKAIRHPINTAQSGGKFISGKVAGAVKSVAATAKGSVNKMKGNFSSAYGEARRSNEPKAKEEED